MTDAETTAETTAAPRAPKAKDEVVRTPGNDENRMIRIKALEDIARRRGISVEDLAAERGEEFLFD